MSSKRKDSYFEGSGPLNPREQANVAYKEMRRSLVRYAAVEAELIERRERGEQLTAVQESLIIGRLHAHRDRAQMFALIYLAEMDASRDPVRKLAYVENM